MQFSQSTIFAAALKAAEAFGNAIVTIDHSSN